MENYSPVKNSYLTTVDIIKTTASMSRSPTTHTKLLVFVHWWKRPFLLLSYALYYDTIIMLVVSLVLSFFQKTLFRSHLSFATIFPRDIWGAMREARTTGSEEKAFKNPPNEKRSFFSFFVACSKNFGWGATFSKTISLCKEYNYENMKIYVH